MRIAKSKPAHVLGRAIRHVAGERPASVTWRVDHGPIFENSVGQISFHGRRADVAVLQARPYEESKQPELDVVIDIQLCADT